MRKVLLISAGILLYIVVFTSYVTASIKKNEWSFDTYTTVKVVKGETLWQIADRYNETFDVSLVTMLDSIYTYNNLKTATIQPGQQLKIPILTR